MPKARTFKSAALAAVHEAASDLQAVGAISKTTMREFDASCVAPPTPLAPAAIRSIRERLRVSQPVFAAYLNTTESTVAKWESGAKRPSGMALKLLHVARKNGLKALV
jgi:putative transcriptional regulator